VKRKVSHALGWMMRPVQFPLLCGFVSLGLSWAYGWARGWQLVWAFVISFGVMLAMQSLFDQIDKTTRRRRPRA
jgi:hypothetical protein